MAPLDLYADDDLVIKAAAYAESYMSHYDASHDWSHILRVLSLAHSIWESERGSLEPSRRKVTLAALLHDVGDKKYLGPDEDGTTLVRDFLVTSGADASLAADVQEICLGVSYSSEMKDRAKVRALIERHPELAVVQDADRLDAIGAVGVGRCFAFGGAKGGDRGMQGSIDHFGEKLLKLEGLMKTETGRKMAKVRTERLRIFEEWWKLENADAI